MTLERLAEIGDIPPEEIEAAIEDLRSSYRKEGLSLDVVEMDGGYMLCVRSEYSEYVSRLYPSIRRGLSHAALETLAIIAYKQPITRMEIERLRGVNVEGVLQGLLEKGLVTEMGRKEGIGRPFLYGTTTRFLQEFNLKDIEDLPDMETFTNSNTQA